jgi:hypothetical protein
LVQELRLASGATEADIIHALATVEDGGIIILPEGETIEISTGLVATVDEAISSLMPEHSFAARRCDVQPYRRG